MPAIGGVPRAQKPVTLSDVARFAGVSIATASKAINGRSEVRASTRERVLVAAEQLGFEPNSLAQALSEGSTGTVGMLTSDLVGRFSLPILMGAEDAFGAGEVSVFLCDARGDAIREQHHLRALLRRRIDGLIVVGDNTDPRPSLGTNMSVPVVYAYAPSLRAEDTSIVTDNVGAGRTAVAHLVTMGRSRIAHVTGDTSSAARQRSEGVRAELSSRGLELAGGEVHFGSWSERWGRDAGRLLLKLDPTIDAVVCGSDQIARGMSEALSAAGRLVPADVAVIGFDNWEVVVAGADPSLTSIDFDLETVGRRAAQLLVEAIGGNPHQGVETVPSKLVVRASTAPA